MLQTKGKNEISYYFANLNGNDLSLTYSSFYGVFESSTDAQTWIDNQESDHNLFVIIDLQEPD